MTIVHRMQHSNRKFSIVKRVGFNRNSAFRVGLCELLAILCFQIVFMLLGKLKKLKSLVEMLSTSHFWVIWFERNRRFSEESEEDIIFLWERVQLLASLLDLSY